LKVPENVTIIPLPAYSPELNPVENLWHYFRIHYWANRAYADYDELRFAVIDAWQKTALDPESIKLFAEFLMLSAIINYNWYKPLFYFGFDEN
jgi:transposase